MDGAVPASNEESEMSTTQFQVPTVDSHWADSRETHIAVATAIHAISSHGRTAELIWAEPTPAEWDAVTQAVENYVASGDFAAEPSGRYAWGCEAITLEDAE